jgi:hypothetical protein
VTLERAHAAVSSLTAQVHAQLHAHRAAGGTDADFLADWVPTFVAQARQHPGPAVLVHMAVAVFDLALACDRIAAQDDLLAMHAEWLALRPE